MANLVACKTCKGQVASNALKCPHCGQRNPGTDFKVAKYIWLAVAGLFVLVIAIAWISDDVSGPAFKAGETYAVSALGYVCATQDALLHIQWNGGSPGDACHWIDKGQSAEALEDAQGNGSMVHIRVSAPLSMANGFEGWTEGSNLKPAS